MQHIDPELFTWLFIGAVGLVAGVWGLTRAASRRRGEAELSRLGKTQRPVVGSALLLDVRMCRRPLKRKPWSPKRLSMALAGRLPFF